jgi:galactitol-specific phosphotransferase system IIC component
MPMSQFIEDMQIRFKNSSSSVALVSSKLFVGFILGLTFSIIGQQIFHYGDFSVMSVIAVTMALFYRISKAWRFAPLLVFALICVLIGLLLRMYIMIAPGS